MSLAQQWRRELADNTRLKLGFVGVATILVISGLLWIGDQRDAVITELIREQGRQARLLGISEDEIWQQRYSELISDRERLASRFWRAASEGQAQAEFQAWLMEVARKYDFERVTLDVVGTGEVAGTPDLWQVALRLNARLEGDALAALLQDLAVEQRLVTVRRLHVRADRFQRFELEAVAWFYQLGMTEAGSRP